jgi:uncharacterized protein (TIGR03083 family)
MTDQRVNLVMRESAQLKSFVNSLPPHAWDVPTACELWNVRDLIAHLVFSMNYQMGMISRGLNGDYSTPAGFAPPGEATAESAGPLVHHLSVDVRDSAGDDLLSVFNSTMDDFDRLLRSLDGPSMNRVCYDVRGLGTVADIIDLRIMELVVHGWDLKSRLDSPAHLPPDSFPSLAAVIGRSVKWIVWPADSLPEPVLYQFDLEDFSPREWDILISGDHVEIYHDAANEPDAKFIGDPEGFLLFMFGRLSLAQMVEAGRMRTDTNPALIAHLDSRFRGF